MNTSECKTELGRLRGAITSGSFDRATAEDALDRLERHLSAEPQRVIVQPDPKSVKPYGNLNPNPPVPVASNTPATPQPASGPHGANPVPEQVGKPFHPGGTATQTPPDTTVRDRP